MPHLFISQTLGFTAVIFRESTVSWWGRTHNIDGCRLSDAIWDESVG